MALDHFSIKVVKGKASEKRYPLGPDLVHVGGSDACELRLFGRDAAPVEFVLQRSNDAYILIAKSPAPIKVNGKETRQAVLSAGTKIETADAVFVYESTQPETRKAAAPGMQDKSVTAAKRRPLILALICVYGAMMLLAALYFMGILKPKTQQTELTLGSRLEQLNKAAGASALPEETKKVVVDAATEALMREDRVRVAETIAGLRSAVELSVTLSGDTYSETEFTADPLRRWVLEEIARQRRRVPAAD